MRILVIGTGGREHAIVWKVVQSSLVERVYCIPGNPGISEIAECPNVSLEGDFNHVADFAENHQITLTVVGPEVPLAKGLVNVFQARGLRVFGPTQQAAVIEASKDFAKNLMVKNYFVSFLSCSFFETNMKNHHPTCLCLDVRNTDIAKPHVQPAFQIYHHKK